MGAVWIPQVAAFLAALVVAWAAKHGFTLDAEQVTATFVGVFAIVKTLLGHWLNPGNVNDPALVEDSKVRASQARAAKAARRGRAI